MSVTSPQPQAARGGLTEPDAPHRTRQSKERYDGRAKVTGKAIYAGDYFVPGMVHGYIVQSTIPCGTLESIDTTAAEQAAGVLCILTSSNARNLPGLPHISSGRLSLLQDLEIHYNGQPIAVVVANHLEQAHYAATLLRIAYRSRGARLQLPEYSAYGRPPKGPGRDAADSTRGDLRECMSKAAVKLAATYTTPIQNHNSMETHSTVAWWDNDKLNLYNSTQSIFGDRQAVAKSLGIPLTDVHVQCPYTGGGFGSKGATWSHVSLAAMAAKAASKPVKIVVERPQMFGPVGSRPATIQNIRLGASRDGKLLAIQHDVILHTSVLDDFLEPSAVQTRMLYSSESVTTTHRLVELNLGVTNHMRAPGEASGTAALESAMDELAVELKMDPVDLRLLNYSERDEGKNLPYTSKNLRQCYKQAADRFGWANRNPMPGQRLERYEFIGCGMATATRHAGRAAAEVVVRILPTGRVLVASGTQDLGTGTYTIMADTAAQVLGLDASLIEVRLGDSTLPEAPASTGSVSAASVCPAVLKAARQARSNLFAIAVADSQSPLHGLSVDDLGLHDGRVFLLKDSSRTEEIVDLIARNGGRAIEATESARPGEEKSAFSAYSFGAVFAEVAVDRDTNMVKVRRVVGTYDLGTLLNPTTGRNQLIGGIVWGISFALHEQSHIDPVFGRTANANLAEYHVPVNADIGDIDVTVLNIPDRIFNALGARGVGEISIAGVPAAIANAVYNATGKRIRDFPITPDKIMMSSNAAGI